MGEIKLEDKFVIELQNEFQKKAIRSILESIGITKDELKFVLQNDFALLLGIISDQSVKSEIAWSLPYKLYLRVGKSKITPQWIIENKNKLAEMLSQKPALHRYPNKMAGYFIFLSQKILTQYDGDVKKFLYSEQDFNTLIANLTSIKGISRKKAGLLCLILELDKHVPIAGQQNSYALMDSHINRVLLDKVGHKVSEQDATAIFKKVYPKNPALVSTVVWNLDRN